MSTRTSIWPPSLPPAPREADGLAFSILTREAKSLTPPSETVRSTFSDLFLRILRGSPPTTGKELGEPPCYGLRDELVHFPAEGRDLLYSARGDEAHCRAGHHVDGLDLGGQGAVQLVHLKLPFEVRDDPEALDDHLRVPLVGEVDDELREDVDLDVGKISEHLPQEADALVEREHRRLVGRVADDSDDDAVEDSRRASDHVDVPVRDRVVGAWCDRGDHWCSNTVTRVEPYFRDVRIASPGSSGSVFADVSKTSSPSSASTPDR